MFVEDSKYITQSYLGKLYRDAQLIWPIQLKECCKSNAKKKMKYENHLICLKTKNPRSREAQNVITLKMKNKPKFMYFPDAHNFLSLLPLRCTFQKSVFRLEISLYLERGGGGAWGNVFLCQGFYLSASLRNKAQQAHQFKPVSSEDNFHPCTAQKRPFACISSAIYTLTGILD